jgi:predicted AAA+ superfamily ATPase
MTAAETLADLSRRILAGYPVLLLRTYEEQRWEEEIAELALDLERGLVTWSVTSGPQPSLTTDSDEGGPASGAASAPRLEPVTFLNQIPEYPSGHLFLLKDLHPYLADPAVVRKIRDLLPQLREQQKTLLLMSPVEDVPTELAKDVSVLELPLPGPDEIRGELQSLLSDPVNGITLQPTPRQEDRLVKAVLGLTMVEARNAFAQVLRGREQIDDDVCADLVAEKRHMVQGSNLLEFFDLEEGIDDIGGLDGLKEWILQRSEAFTADAQTRGVANPKGVLLAGVQGCGKSLSAKAIARILGFPLVRMDLGNLLESSRGSSEQNLRDVLRLMEMIAPSVLWLEEIDKAFAGFTDEASTDATLSRLLGRFLTWLQEHDQPVFVVATANNVHALPPELLRRGRFDELFFVDLPNYEERKAIFSIHLSRRGWKTEKFDVEQLASETEGYSGAEIEQIVNSAVIESYAQNRMLTQKDLHESRERTVPLSVTMEDEIFSLREWARGRCRPATTDHRVIQVMEEEERRGEAPAAEEQETPKWVQLAEHGQLQAAVVEHVRYHDNVTWRQLLEDFSRHTSTQGEFGLVLRADPKIVLWTRMSREMADVLSGYINGKRLYLHPAPENYYPAESRPRLPVIDALPENRVEKPVWIPTLFRLLPPVEGSGKFAHVVRIRLGKPG